MTASEEKRIEIVIPVYNDWESLLLLINRVCSCLGKEGCARHFAFTIVNDCSTIPLDESRLPREISVRIIELNRNLGHQKAIAIGLSYVRIHANPDHVIVMDADGEDRPEDIEKLIAGADATPGTIVFASRSKRHERGFFRLFYCFYKKFFRLLIGKSITFGNFCIIPRPILQHVVYISEIWNHFSGGIIRSKLPYTSIPLERGKRLKGNPKMHFIDLVLHGLSSIAIYVDVVSIRLLLLSSLFIAISLCGILLVIGIKLFTSLAIPGWATYALIGFIIIILQAFMMSILLAFLILHYRTQRMMIPAKDYEDFISQVKMNE